MRCFKVPSKPFWDSRICTCVLQRHRIYFLKSVVDRSDKNLLSPESRGVLKEKTKQTNFLCLLLVLLQIWAAGKLLKEYLQAALCGRFSTAQLVNDSKSGLVTAPEIKPILPEEESLRTEKSGCIFFHLCLCTPQSRVNKANLLMRNMSIKELLNVLETVTSRCFD